MATPLFIIGCVIGFALIQDNPQTIISVAAVLLTAFGLQHRYKKDKQIDRDEYTKLKIRVEHAEKNREVCLLDQAKRENKADEKFSILFKKIDDIPERVAQTVNSIRIEQDIKLQETNRRIDDILKNKK